MRYKKTIFFSTLISSLMFCFCFAMVPLYKKYCQFTGINTSVRIEAFADLSRKLTVQFIAENNLNLKWDFYPTQKSIRIHPDEVVKVIFNAKNNSDHTITVRAIPSLTPGIATLYFHKLECFCFSRQTLKAGEQRQWPMVFIVDKKVPDDLKFITLAYTLFDVTHEMKNRKVT